MSLLTSIDWLLLLGCRVLLLLGLAFALSFVLRDRHARARYTLWTATIIGILAVPVLTIAAPTWTIDALSPQRWFNPDFAIGRTWSLGVAIIWGGGAVLLLVRLGLGVVSAGRLSRTSEPVTGKAWNDLIAELTLRLGIIRPVRVRFSKSIGTPITTGTRGPVVILPMAAAEWSEERRRIVLLHELVHVRRWDWTFQVASQIACALYWPIPLVWMGASRLVIERERSCDQDVIEFGTKPSLYADHLLSIARLLHRRRLSCLAALSMARQSQLEGRLVTILQSEPSSPPRSTIALALASLMMVASVAVATLRPAMPPAAADLVVVNDAEINDLMRRCAKIDVIATDLEDVMDEIHEDKDPYYERRDELEATVVAIDESTSQLADDETVMLGTFAERRQTALREIAEINEILDPLIDEWNAALDSLEDALDEMDVIVESCDDRIREIIRHRLDAALVAHGGIEIPFDRIVGTADCAVDLSSPFLDEQDALLVLSIPRDAARSCLEETLGLDGPRSARLLERMAADMSLLAFRVTLD